MLKTLAINSIYYLEAIKKNMVKKLLIIVCIVSLYSMGGLAQQGSLVMQPEVGKPMPDFVLQNVKYYKSNTASLQDFKGKWLFLDFWFTGCTACIQSFPKINLIQQNFLHEVQYVLVGVNKRSMGGNIEKVYQRIREKLDLKLVSAYDSALSERWKITSMPHIIIVDPGGVVRYITSGTDLTLDKVAKLVSGESVSLKQKVNQQPIFDVTKYPGSEDDNLIYRSILTKSKGERATTPDFNRYVNWPLEYRKQGIKVASAEILTLYRIAYYGNNTCSVLNADNGMLFYPGVVLEVTDKTPFAPDPNSIDFEGFYNYNLSVPPAKSRDLNYIKSVFQHELKCMFGYEVTLEKRRMPIWKLVAKAGASERLKTKGGNVYLGDGTGSGALPAGFSARNISTKTLLNQITYYIECSQPPFFDETNIDHNIDISINASMIDLEDIKISLKRNGLDIVSDSTEFLVLVLKDPSQPN